MGAEQNAEPDVAIKLAPPVSFPFDDKEGYEMTSQQSTYESWSNEDLIQAATVDRQDYLPEAMIMIEAELKRRNVSSEGRNGSVNFFV